MSSGSAWGAGWGVSNVTKKQGPRYNATGAQPRASGDEQRRGGVMIWLPSCAAPPSAAVAAAACSLASLERGRMHALVTGLPVCCLRSPWRRPTAPVCRPADRSTPRDVPQAAAAAVGVCIGVYGDDVRGSIRACAIEDNTPTGKLPGGSKQLGAACDASVSILAAPEDVKPRCTGTFTNTHNDNKTAAGIDQRSCSPTLHGSPALRRAF